MNNLKNITEFQKCGEIMMAAKKNKFAMVCNFCQQSFVLLQTFMRHLQLQHNDKLEFVKQTKEITIYAVEELINQASTSCPPDIESDESNSAEENAKRLTQDHMKMPDENVAHNKSQEQNILVRSANETEGLSMVNMSILKALEDCDVPFGLIDGLNIPQCSEEKKVSTISNTLLQDIQDDWQNSNINDSFSNGINCIDIKMLKWSECLNDYSIMEQNISNDEKKRNTCKGKLETSTSECIRSLLSGLENIDDVDSLLKNLESNITDIEKICKTSVSPPNHFVINGNKVLGETNSDINSDCIEHFEICLNELENDLDIDITNGNSIVLKNANNTKIPKSFHYETQNHTIKSKDISHTNFDIQLQNFEKGLKESEKKADHFINILNGKNQSDDIIPLNEDLTKALADALNYEDFDLLNINPEEGSEEILNQDILSLLEKQLTEEENDLELNLVKKHKNLEGIIKITENDAIKTVKTQQQSMNNINRNNISKYKKTNLKAKRKTHEKTSKKFAKHTKPFVLRESNSVDSYTTLKNSLNGLKGNHIHGHRQTNSSNVAKETVENVYYEMPNIPMQRKILTKESQETITSALNVRQIKKEKLTGKTETLLKRERLFLKDSPEYKINKSPKTQDYQQNLKQKFTPPSAGHKTVQPTKKESLKESRKAASNEHNVKTSNSFKLYESLISKEQKIPSPCLTKTNKKSPTLTQTTLNLHYNAAKTPTKLKNVTIRLQRLTPQKLLHQLPKEIISPTVPNQTSSPGANQSIIIETPIKATTYCKQNFSESSLEICQNNETKNLNPINENSSLMQTQSHISNKTKTKAIFSNLRQRNASIDAVPSSQGNTKQQTQRIANGSPRNSNLDYKSYAINRSVRKKQVLQRMNHIKKQIFKSIEQGENKVHMDSIPIKQQKKQKVLIENIQILPNRGNRAISSLTFNNLKEHYEINTTTQSVLLPKKSAHHQRKEVDSQNQSFIENDENLIKKYFKRPALSPLLNESKQAKLQHKTPIGEQKKVFEKTSYLEAALLDASENIVESLQDKDQTPRDVMQKEDLPNKKETLTNSTNLEDFDDAKDNDLLDKFGLTIIKYPEIEDTMTLEERDEMNEKAIKFANIYKNWPRIWRTKNGESVTVKQDLTKSFKQLLTEVNQSFKLDLSIVDIKRLANLINIWYTHNFSTKFFEKRKIPEATHRYLLMFHFIPKTTKHLHYCEYCEECLSTEHKYFKHRIIHTGALFPFTCQNCLVGFKSVGLSKKHKSLCN